MTTRWSGEGEPVRYWLGPWVWQASPFPHWARPGGAVASIDLRSVPHCVATVTPQGSALFATANNTNLGSNYTNLGTDPDAVLTGQQRLSWQSRFGLPNALAANTLRQAAWETLTVQSDPTGDDRCPPLVPTTRRRFEVWLAGELVGSKVFQLGDDEVAPLLDRLRRVYRVIRQECLDGIAPVTLYRKWLGAMARKFGVDYRNFVPGDLPDEGELQPETIWRESFNTADSTTLGPDLTWSEVTGDLSIVSNTCNCVSTNTNSAARAQHDLSSTDHYAQIDATTLTSSGTDTTAVGACARFASAATTYYVSNLENRSATDSIVLYKRVTGTFTQLDITTQANSVPDTIRLTCDGSSISDTFNGVAKNSVTDTAITTGTRCGVNLFRTGGSSTTRADSFEAGDLRIFLAPPKRRTSVRHMLVR